MLLDRLFSKKEAAWEEILQKHVFSFFPYVASYDRAYKCSFCEHIVQRNTLKRCPKCKSVMVGVVKKEESR